MALLGLCARLVGNQEAKYFRVLDHIGWCFVWVKVKLAGRLLYGVVSLHWLLATRKFEFSVVGLLALGMHLLKTSGPSLSGGVFGGSLGGGLGCTPTNPGVRVELRLTKLHPKRELNPDIG